MTHRIAVLPGDGIGPETVAGAVTVLQAAAAAFAFELDLSEHPFGGAAIDVSGEPFPAETRDACLAADAVLKGAIGGPQWAPGVAEEAIFAIRAQLGVYANVRPSRAVTRRWVSPLRAELAEGIDLIIVRELNGGLYYGARGRDGDSAFDTCTYTADEIRRLVRRGFQLAERRRQRVTSVDKANVLDTSRLWREVVDEVAAEFPGVAVDHQLVDSMTMKLVEQPASYDVIVTENLFGDILSDLAASVAGGIGLAPSASLGDAGPALFEAIHGSAPDIAGTGSANPAATILSVAMLLDELGEAPAARAVEAAVTAVLDDGPVTPDLGGAASTDEVARAVADAVRRSHAPPAPSVSAPR